MFNRQRSILNAQVRTGSHRRDGYEVVSSPESACRVAEALDGLPQRYRLPVWLHHGEGLSWGDVAAVLCVSERRARRRGERGGRLLTSRLTRAGMAIPRAGIGSVVRSNDGEVAPPMLAERIDEIIRAERSGCPDRVGGTASDAEIFAPADPGWRIAVWIAFAVLAIMLVWSAEVRRWEVDVVGRRVDLLLQGGSIGGAEE